MTALNLNFRGKLNMHHHTQSGSGKQIPLAFNSMGTLDSASVLHTAYTRLELSRRLSFEQVMSNRAYAIGVRNLADAIARRRLVETRAKSIATDKAVKNTAPSTNPLGGNPTRVRPLWV
jgi:hypothetical protein